MGQFEKNHILYNKETKLKTQSKIYLSFSNHTVFF